MNNFLLSKIVAPTTNTAYSQVYSTHNLFIVIGLKRKAKETVEESLIMNEKPITIVGKELLERVLREFFAQDIKNLQTSKQAVSISVESIKENFECSLILLNVISDIAYIVISGAGSVVLHRKNRSGTIAKSEIDTLHSFSGKIQQEDILILQTATFEDKIGTTSYIPQSSIYTITEIAENFTPHIHENPIGNEAAIILQYKIIDEPSYESPTSAEDEEEKPVSAYIEPSKKTLITTVFQRAVQQMFQTFLSSFRKITLSKPSQQSVTQPANIVDAIKQLLSQYKKIIIVALVAILLIFFLYTLISERQKQQTRQQEQLYQSIIEPIQKRYDDGVALIPLSKPLAQENFSQAKQLIEANKNKFPYDSPERKKLEDLENAINAQLTNTMNPSSSVKAKIILDTKKDKQITNIAAITYKGGELLAVDGKTGTVGFIKQDGGLSQAVQSSTVNASIVTADTNVIFLLDKDSVTRVDKKSEKTKKIISSLPNNCLIDTFLGNIYVINPTNNHIEKYPAPSYEKADYITNNGNLGKKAVSFTIDGSLWILLDNGSIVKYTKGQKEDFQIKNLPKPLSALSLLYTDQDYNNLYILDTQNKIMTILSKTGELIRQTQLPSSKTIVSFAVDEPDKKIFLATGETITSIDLP